MAGILIADDSSFIRDDLKKALQSAGHSVLEAEDGAAGVGVFEKQAESVEIIVCDINMPNLDGVSMCRQILGICESRKLPMPPVLALTTETKPELKAEGKKAGIVAWIPKPFDAAKLNQAISTLLARKGK
jgi:two-component system chemotaxis response regulator CheY